MSLKTTLRNLLDRILENFALKVISLVISVLLWLYIKGLTSVSYDFYIPINYVGLPIDKIIVNQSMLPNYVMVKIKGEKNEVSKLFDVPKNSFYALVDLSKTNSGSKYRVNVTLPEIVKTLDIQIYPSEVFVDVDEIVETNIPVTVRNSEDYVVIPETVKVRTISRNLKNISKIELEVDLSKKVDKIVLQGYQFLTFIPDVVTVSNTNIIRGN
ncbi:MAG: hypothetical protein ACK4F9_05505 [Brevinematia bacterium]